MGKKSEEEKYELMTENKQENPEEVVLHVIVQLYCMEQHQLFRVLKDFLCRQLEGNLYFGGVFCGKKNK